MAVDDCISNYKQFRETFVSTISIHLLHVLWDSSMIPIRLPLAEIAISGYERLDCSD